MCRNPSTPKHFFFHFATASSSREVIPCSPKAWFFRAGFAPLLRITFRKTFSGYRPTTPPQPPLKCFLSQLLILHIDHSTWLPSHDSQTDLAEPPYGPFTSNLWPCLFLIFPCSFGAVSTLSPHTSASREYNSVVGAHPHKLTLV